MGVVFVTFITEHMSQLWFIFIVLNTHTQSLLRSVCSETTVRQCCSFFYTEVFKEPQVLPDQ